MKILVKGFTYVEMIAVIALAAILAVIAVPSLRQTNSQTTDYIAQAKLLQQVGQAQQVSLAKMTSVAICLSNDGKTCVAKGATILLTFIDTHNDGVVHEGSQIISSSFMPGNGEMHLRSYPNYRHYLLILPVTQSVSDNGTLWYCNTDSNVQWAVTVSQLGEGHAAENVSGMQLAC